MNRLWVRISLAITIVVIFATLLPIIIGIAVREFRYQEELLPLSDVTKPVEIDPEHPEGYPARKHPFFPGRFVLDNIAPLLAAVTIVGVSAGVLLSHGLSAPLSNLAEAARAIGRRDLGQRVGVKGSQEVRDLARAFNDMAADLEQAETLRQNLLADVAHELRTPLSVIQGNLQGILDDVFELDKAEIARLYDQTRQLSRLVDDLRELAQAEAQQLHFRMDPVNLGNLISQVSPAYAASAEAAGLEFETRIEEELPMITGDRDRLGQCLGNLLTNAICNTPEGGRVTLSLRAAGEKLTIEVKDTGNGIAPEHLPYIFDRFYRADPARARASGGTGLGLAITRAIIEAHGGEIEAQSQGDSQGSTFTVHLPTAL